MKNNWKRCHQVHRRFAMRERWASFAQHFYFFVLTSAAGRKISSQNGKPIASRGYCVWKCEACHQQTIILPCNRCEAAFVHSCSAFKLDSLRLFFHHVLYHPSTHITYHSHTHTHYAVTLRCTHIHLPHTNKSIGHLLMLPILMLR